MLIGLSSEFLLGNMEQIPKLRGVGGGGFDCNARHHSNGEAFPIHQPHHHHGHPTAYSLNCHQSLRHHYGDFHYDHTTPPHYRHHILSHKS